MSLFQSEEMTLCQLFLQSEAAYHCVSELGELGLAQFRDLNPDVNAFQRKFVNEVRRCDEMERKLRYLEKEIKKDGIPMLDLGENPDAPLPREMIDLEATFEKLENELREVNQNAEALKKNYLDLTELRHILRKTQVFFDEREGDDGQSQAPAEIRTIQEATFSAPIAPGMNAPPQLGFVAGVILRERLPAFERLLWRTCRGLVYLRQAEIETPLEDPSSGDQVYKSVFVIFFQGDQLKTRVKKICEGFRATLYPCPETPAERREMSIGVMTRIEDLNTVLSQTQDHRHRVLVSAAKQIKNWFIKARKIKAIYHTLNLFNLDVTEKCLISECWIPVADIENIQMAMRRGTERTGSTVPPILNRMQTTQDPPTYHRLNKFTRGFQNLVDAYGIASYREVNPAPYTIITFPFLFAIMFGDAGHALLMLLFGAWMVIKESSLLKMKSKNEIWNIFFGGRYIILLMGIFSFYTGLIYNDVFSKSINIFGSYWYVNRTQAYLQEPDVKEVMLDPKTSFYDYPYPVGLDPVWQVATNKIAYLNGYKMKISIIHGVVHMIFGVVLSLWNHVYFRRPINIFCEFIPQLIFMLFLFLYLCILVFHKWIYYGARMVEGRYNEHCAPSILITFINMVLFKGADKTEPPCNNYMFTGQEILQKFLVLAALLCVPWMLFIKPFILRSQHNKKMLLEGKVHQTGGDDLESGETNGIATEDTNASTAPVPATNGGQTAAPSSAGGGAHGGGHGHGEEEFEFSEIFIHQAIHTIEYVLGSVSHTASYLRLWALSLAHAQLSEVLWSMVLRIGLAQKAWWGGILLWAIFGAWAVLTVSILVLMEGLSAFLHTLRLHWVEFQSKFYTGQGYQFTPFSFKDMLAAADGLDAAD
ncbi:V-type proton ATPase 116 kDa subunit a1 isoform X2 [Folsomia candida]|uniref:V-type proton ATPase 116 kDa subunit a1 isoform X2 n=1 Tax=Folsomia candida TaxID=158441 RepID=UPI000B8F98F7|nr:V-type proton ATPase 116 kDa subunit a1 isoform X2 [Folsomia candida]